jgi:hypothetical protein
VCLSPGMRRAVSHASGRPEARRVILSDL